MFNLNIGNLKKAVDFDYREPQMNFPFIDEWVPIDESSRLIRGEAKDVIIVPISKLYGHEKQTMLDFFYICTKRGYRQDKVRRHTAHYLNYLENFFDPDHELISIYGFIKYMMDTQKSYSKENLFNDIKNHLLDISIRFKVRSLVKYNYQLNLKEYKNKSDHGLEYNDSHGMIMLEISMLFNIVYPLLTHFLYVKGNTFTEEPDSFLLEMYDYILDLYHVDIYNKLYETSLSNIISHKSSNPIWEKQDIRGKNVTTHTLYTVENIILNGIIKYVFNQNIVSYNVSIIGGSNDYQIAEIGYELDYRPHSSSERDADNQSQFDKFENYLIKENESLFIQNKVNCEYTMKQIEKLYGPFDQNEINFYIQQFTEDNRFMMNNFQKDYLVFNLFYKYFGDPMSINSITRDDYVKLIIAGKKMLQSSNLVVLPYIFSAKVVRLGRRKSLNKKEMIKIKSSKYYSSIIDKYRNEKIENLIIECIAIILSSEFRAIEFDDPEGKINGKKINCLNITEIIVEEMLMFITMI